MQQSLTQQSKFEQNCSLSNSQLQRRSQFATEKFEEMQTEETSYNESCNSSNQSAHFVRKVQRGKQSLLISLFKSKKSGLFNSLANNAFPVPQSKKAKYWKSIDSIASTDDETNCNYSEESPLFSKTFCSTASFESKSSRKSNSSDNIPSFTDETFENEFDMKVKYDFNMELIATKKNGGNFQNRSASFNIGERKTNEKEAPKCPSIRNSCKVERAQLFPSVKGLNQERKLSSFAQIKNQVDEDKNESKIMKCSKMAIEHKTEENSNESEEKSQASSIRQNGGEWIRGLKGTIAMDCISCFQNQFPRKINSENQAEFAKNCQEMLEYCDANEELIGSTQPETVAGCILLLASSQVGIGKIEFLRALAPMKKAMFTKICLIKKARSYKVLKSAFGKMLNDRK